MKDCLVRYWSVVCLLLFSTAIHCSHYQLPCTRGRRGQVHVSGTEHENFTAGLIYICDGAEWRVVCGSNWDLNDARVVCREVDFPAEVAQFCTNSCFGRNLDFRGAASFMCKGNETRLSKCNYRKLRNWGRCPWDEYVGVICVRSPALSCQPPSTTPPNSVVTTPSTPCEEPITCTPCDQLTTAFTKSSTPCDCMDTPSTTPTITHSPTNSPSTNITTSEGNTESSEDTTSTVVANTAASSTGNTVVIAALGTVSTLLLLALVGVVTGWVWSCHRNKKTTREWIGNTGDNDFHNPTYSAAMPTTTTTVSPIQYSSLGPRDTPTTGHAPTQEGEEEEGMYHMMEDVGGGMVYEIPVQGQGREERTRGTGEMAYSTLHHN